MDGSQLFGAALLIFGIGAWLLPKLGGFANLKLPFTSSKTKTASKFEAWEKLAHEAKDKPDALKLLNEVLPLLTKAEDVE